MKAWFVTKRLAFGSAITTKGHVEQLRTLGITHVINLRHRKHGKRICQFKNLWLPFKDDFQPRPKWFHRRALKFYQKAMRRPDTKILCMCHHGFCRSPSLVYFFLRLEGLSIGSAKTAVLKARKTARVVPDYWRSGEDYLSLHRFRQKIKGNKTKSQSGAAQ